MISKSKYVKSLLLATCRDFTQLQNNWFCTSEWAEAINILHDIEDGVKIDATTLNRTISRDQELRLLVDRFTFVNSNGIYIGNDPSTKKKYIFSSSNRIILPKFRDDWIDLVVDSLPSSFLRRFSRRKKDKSTYRKDIAAIIVCNGSKMDSITATRNEICSENQSLQVVKNPVIEINEDLIREKQKLSDGLSLLVFGIEIRKYSNKLVRTVTNIKSESTKRFVWQELLLVTKNAELDVSMANRKMQPVLKFLYPRSYVLQQKKKTQKKTNLYSVNGL